MKRGSRRIDRLELELLAGEDEPRRPGSHRSFDLPLLLVDRALMAAWSVYSYALARM